MPANGHRRCRWGRSGFKSKRWLPTARQKIGSQGPHLYTGGADWTRRFPLIAKNASRLHAQSFYMDGEGVVCGDDGVAVYDELHGRSNDHAVFLYAFDLLE